MAVLIFVQEIINISKIAYSYFMVSIKDSNHYYYVKILKFNSLTMQSVNKEERCVMQFFHPQFNSKRYFMSMKSWPILYNKLLYDIGQSFFDIQYKVLLRAT